ncbi:putative transposase for insertion sequence element [Anaerolinea thermophila UNI-1]|uniref:Transposase for insertion sequence element n=1 Tax=Anaerolinea thermophila (strain DSM 14523 / JCM 11388 / NBRC 100420 / UNI-1) TaxID=926569 RepID=E8MXF7_ANATU|nr:putative transposase for insertion sequence element [Anaerolinea thermophila UNI-1]BAJ62598.1 putative transposase for insertion sequence element [Anaerolinea thermophila UNI-1]BAJ62828.1 putative transposase for insertion sequence element [Anaerolinea thermophila UNI-1]BAJ62950.1 putative transposase for insertion sequence element [Anaerolinea thermophila UNI-1]BAJ63070.1 putative transposase for insertion sequence element [Anaerolinea thermophila UNI-1]
MTTRESRYVRVARIAYRLAKQALPMYSHAKSPHHFTLPQLGACVLLMFYLNLSYRDMEEWLLASDAVGKELELPRVPDHTTLQRTYAKIRKADWMRMNETLLEEIGRPEEEGVAADSTGFSPGPASSYYQSRSGKAYRHWAKGVYAVGIVSQFILAMQSGWGPGSDAPYLGYLRRKARRFAKRRAWVLLADSGFDGRTVRPQDLIPPVRRGGNLLAPERRARSELVSAARLDGLYGQRWKTETVNSVIKRKFGQAIRSRKRSLQNREPIIKGLVYNIHR